MATRDCTATVTFFADEPNEISYDVRGNVDLESEDINSVVITEVIHPTDGKSDVRCFMPREQRAFGDALWEAAEAQEHSELKARAAERAADARRDELLEYCHALAVVSGVARE